jgi:hypothetical protein
VPAAPCHLGAVTGWLTIYGLHSTAGIDKSHQQKTSVARSEVIKLRETLLRRKGLQRQQGCSRSHAADYLHAIYHHDLLKPSQKKNVSPSSKVRRIRRSHNSAKRLTARRLLIMAVSTTNARSEQKGLQSLPAIRPAKTCGLDSEYRGRRSKANLYGFALIFKSLFLAQDIVNISALVMRITRDANKFAMSWSIDSSSRAVA